MTTTNTTIETIIATVTYNAANAADTTMPNYQPQNDAINPANEQIAAEDYITV